MKINMIIGKKYKMLKVKKGKLFHEKLWIK